MTHGRKKPVALGLGPCPTGGHASDSAPNSHTGHAEVGEQPPGCPHRGLAFWPRRRRDLVLARRGVSLPRTLCSPTTPPVPPKGLISATPTCQLPRQLPQPSALAQGWAQPGCGCRDAQPVPCPRGTRGRGPPTAQSPAASWCALQTATVVSESPSEPGHQTGARVDTSATPGQRMHGHFPPCLLPS